MPIPNRNGYQTAWSRRVLCRHHRRHHNDVSVIAVTPCRIWRTWSTARSPCIEDRQARATRPERKKKKTGPHEGGPVARMLAWGPANFRGNKLRHRRLWEDIHDAAARHHYASQALSLQRQTQHVCHAKSQFVSWARDGLHDRHACDDRRAPFNLTRRNSFKNSSVERSPPGSHETLECARPI